MEDPYGPADMVYSHYCLDQLAELDNDSHDLPGAAHCLAELQKYFAEKARAPKLETPRPLPQVLDFAPWL